MPEKKTAAHFIRKLSQLDATFIHNQIAEHKRYRPVLIYKEQQQLSERSETLLSNLPNLNCDICQSGLKKTYSDFIYRKFRKLTSEDEKTILNFLKEHNVSICHFHYGTDAGMYLKVIKRVKIPSVVSFYGYDCSSFPSWYFGYGKLYLRRVFHEADIFLSMSEDMKKDLIALGCPEEKIIVHYHGTDVQKFQFKREYKDSDPVSLLIVAALVPQKGHIFLFEALKDVIQKIPDIQLRIVGDSFGKYFYLKDDFKKFIETNRLSGNVTFLGALPYLSQEFFEEFKNADIFVHPSVISETGEKEGIPGTIIEAMASGLPVITTYHAGIPYIIDNRKTGILIKEWDVDALSEAIINLALDRPARERIGKNGREFAVNNLDLKVKEVELEDLYDMVINSNA